jgi:hypothetical protein
MKMIDRTLRLTWRKALLMAAVYAGLLLVHFVIRGALHVDEPVLFLAAVFLVPIWAISAAVYTFDELAIRRGGRWRHPA